MFCNKNENLKSEANISKKINIESEKPKFENTFKSHLYIVGPHLDDQGNLELGCDCCSSQFYFCDSIHFIEVAYCLEADDLLIGEYSVNKDGLTLKYNNKYLSMETNLVDDSTSTKYIHNEEKNNISFVTWKRHYNRRFYNTSNDEVSEQRDSLKSSFIKTINNDKEVSKFLRKNNIKL